MSLATEIAEIASATGDVMAERTQEQSYAPFAGQISPVRRRLAESRKSFEFSGASGTTVLKATVSAAKAAVDAMVPDAASVDAAMAKVRAAADALKAATPAASGGFLESIRGSLRFEAAPVPRGGPVLEGAAVAAADDGKQSPPPGDPNYYQRLTGLFPAEALALYGTGVALFGGANLFVVLVALVVLLILRYIATQPSGGGAPDWLAIGVAVLSYLLWSVASDPEWLAGLLTATEEAAKLLALNLQKGAAFIGAAVVVLAPLVVKPKPA